jgi:hypothetical protein
MEYQHFLFGENNISQKDQQTYVIKLSHPPCSIRFNYLDSIFASYEEFYKNIADVQFFSGERPSDKEVDEILTDAWNFLALEERRLDEEGY